jgi:hypothetical protein
MRFRTLEIRWHDSKPISTCDFQPVAFKKARPAAGQEKNFAGQSYRLATGGEDNHVRVRTITKDLSFRKRISRFNFGFYLDMDRAP